MFGTSTATITQPQFPPQAVPVMPLDRLTFAQLCALEPRLLDLYNEISSIKDEGGESFCANRVWDEYHPEWDDRSRSGANTSFKGRLFRLVRFACNHPDPVMHSWQAHRVAHDKIYGALPDCRNCVCFGFQAIIDAAMGCSKQRYH